MSNPLHLPRGSTAVMSTSTLLAIASAGTSCRDHPLLALIGLFGRGIELRYRVSRWRRVPGSISQLFD